MMSREPGLKKKNKYLEKTKNKSTPELCIIKTKTRKHKKDLACSCLKWGLDLTALKELDAQRQCSSARAVGNGNRGSTAVATAVQYIPVNMMQYTRTMYVRVIHTRYIAIPFLGYAVWYVPHGEHITDSSIIKARDIYVLPGMYVDAASNN